MRLSSLRIIWITLFSIVTLLSSSVVASSPLMTFNMLTTMSASHISKNSSLSGCHDHLSNSASSASSHEHGIEKTASHCDSDSKSVHNCCSATCINIMAFVPNSVNHALLSEELALIEGSTQKVFSLYPQSLYRPPIASSNV